MTKFKIDETYSCKSVCDQDCVWSFIVISRTDKTITLADQDRKVVTKKISMHYDGTTETCFPLGRYSMAPILKAA